MDFGGVGRRPESSVVTVVTATDFGQKASCVADDPFVGNLSHGEMKFLVQGFHSLMCCYTCMALPRTGGRTLPRFLTIGWTK